MTEESSESTFSFSAAEIEPRRSVRRTEIRFAWFLCVLAVAALLVEAAWNRRDGLGDAYRLAVGAAERNPAVIAALGTPIKARWMPDLGIETGPGYRRVDLSIRLTGPRTEGVLQARLERHWGPWRIEEQRLKLKGSQKTLDLASRSSRGQDAQALKRRGDQLGNGGMNVDPP